MIDLPNTNNYFDFYGLPQSIDIDKTLLRQKFLEKSKQYHPDFFSEQPEELNKAIEITAFNNKAYKTLNQFYTCAQYLIDLNSNDLNKELNLPQDFLMEMMDINEEIDLLDNSNKDKIAEIESHITEYETKESGQLRELMNKLLYNEAQQSVLKIKYLERLKQRLKSI